VSTFPLRQKFVEIARRNVGKTEVTKNQAPWIAPLWTATTYEDGMKERQPYCAAGMAWCLREWLMLPEVRQALEMNTETAEKWRCKSAKAFDWGNWARKKGLLFVPKAGNFHAGDIIIYSFSHIEVYVDDVDGGPSFTAIGYNTNAAGSRDGEGCFEKPRPRTKIKEVFRILP